MNWMARILGLATLVYSVVVLVRPRLLVTPTGLIAKAEPVTVPAAALTRGIAARDAIVGLAMMFAPGGAALVTAVLVRIGCDFSDAAGFGVAVADRTARLKTVGVATGWGVLNLIALWLAWP